MESQETGRWDSATTWIAVGTLLFYCAFTFGFPLIPWVIRADAMGGILLRYTPIVALVLWMAAMWDRYRRRQVRGQVLWTGIRYGIISLGVAGVLVGLFIPSHIRWTVFTLGNIKLTENFRKEMQKTADLQAIRLWAKSYRPVVVGAEVPDKEWPESIQRIHPWFVMYNPSDKIVTLFFLGGRGLEVGPKGTGPAAGDDYTLPLDDGAWVWFRMRD